MRAEIGKLTLDLTFSERQTLNLRIVEAIGKSSDGWGVAVERYEIKDIAVPPQIRAAMELEAEAERKKRKAILDSEAERQSAENIALGKKRATELISEADMVEQINNAKGEAFAISVRAEAVAASIKSIAKAIEENGNHGERAVQFKIAEEYVKQFGKIAQKSTTVVVPATVTDASGMIASAMTVFDKLKTKSEQDMSSVTPTAATEKLIQDVLSAVKQQQVKKE